MIGPQFFQNRRTLLVFIFGAFLYATNRYFSILSVSQPLIVTNLEGKSEQKKSFQIVEIKDRKPSYRLAIFDDYKVQSGRNRAINKLIDTLKLCEKCQQDPKTLVVDVGACLGEFSLYAAACGCQVHMYEVEPKKLSLIQTSIKLNSFESRVQLFPYTVNDLPSKGSAQVYSNTSAQVARDLSASAMNTYHVQSISFNDIEFPSPIFLLKIAAEGRELNVLRGSEKHFRQHHVRHLIFEYTAWWTDRAAQKDLLSYVKTILGAKKFYALHPSEATIYGPLFDEDITEFHSQHITKHVQRDVYAPFDVGSPNINSQPYDFKTSFP